MRWARENPGVAEVITDESVDALAEALDNYHLLHAARADLLRRLGSLSEATKSYEQALALVVNESERRYLERRLREIQARGAGL